VSDGLLLIRRRRPIGEPGTASAPEHGEVVTIDGTAGAGRIALALAAAGLHETDMLQAVVPSEIEVDELRALDLGGTFRVVVLGSHLVNLPDEARRAAHVAAAARHVAPDGELILEHHPIDWAATAADVEPTPGSSVGMEAVRRDPPFVSAVSVYDVGGRMARQPFTARVLSDAELAAAVAAVGFGRTHRLAPTLIGATRGA
jgi:hypothetical protein